MLDRIAAIYCVLYPEAIGVDVYTRRRPTDGRSVGYTVTVRGLTEDEDEIGPEIEGPAQPTLNLAVTQLLGEMIRRLAEQLDKLFALRFESDSAEELRR